MFILTDLLINMLTICQRQIVYSDKERSNCILVNVSENQISANHNNGVMFPHSKFG